MNCQIALEPNAKVFIVKANIMNQLQILLDKYIKESEDKKPFLDDPFVKKVDVIKLIINRLSEHYQIDMSEIDVFIEEDKHYIIQGNPISVGCLDFIISLERYFNYIYEQFANETDYFSNELEYKMFINTITEAYKLCTELYDLQYAKENNIDL